MNDKCPNVKEVPGICDGLPVFCRGCTESVNRCTQLMSESRDEARKELKAALLQNDELKRDLQGTDEARAGAEEKLEVALRLVGRMKNALERILNWEDGVRKPGGEYDIYTICQEGLGLEKGQPTKKRIEGSKNETRPESPVLLGVPDGRAPLRMHVSPVYEPCPICGKEACGHFNEPKP